jgi:hypothetical protein
VAALTRLTASARETLWLGSETIFPSLRNNPEIDRFVKGGRQIRGTVRMVVLKELFIALAAIVLLLFVSNALLGPDELTTTSVAAAPAPAPERANLTPQERIDAVFDQFAGKKSRARIN